MNINRVYYTQDVKYSGSDLILPTDWFHSTGVTKTLDQKPEMLVPISEFHSQVLKTVEDLAIQSAAKLTNEFSPHDINEATYKRLPENQKLYIKLHHEAAFFDKNCQRLNLDALSKGDYRLMIHVKSLYIGFHPSGKLVSLQLRVIQLQHISRVPQCLFSNMSDLPQIPATITPPKNIAKNTEASVPNKRGRKPKLQRQNALSDVRIQQEEHRRLESIPADFFDNIDLSTLGN